MRMNKAKHTGKWCKCQIDNDKTAVLLNQAGKWYWTDTGNCIDANNRKITPLKIMGEVGDYSCRVGPAAERRPMQYLMIDHSGKTHQFFKNIDALKDTIFDLFPGSILVERQEEGKLVFLDIHTHEQLTIRREVVWDIKIVRK